MASIADIPAGERGVLAPLFDAHEHDTVIMRSVLEGHFGSAHADSRTAPRVARLDSGAFTLLGGDPEAGAASALIRHKPISYVTPETSGWRRILEGEFAERLSSLSFTEFSWQVLEAGRLENLTGKLPDEFELKAVDRPLALSIPSELENEYFFENFDSVDDFLGRGLGFCIQYRGRVVSAATSMAMCDGAIDIEIETAPQFRRRGLATVAGARLVLECLRMDIEPRWLAANVESEKLAEKLGYLKTRSYETLEVESVQGETV